MGNYSERRQRGVSTDASKGKGRHARADLEIAEHGPRVADGARVTLQLHEPCASAVIIELWLTSGKRAARSKRDLKIGASRHSCGRATRKVERSRFVRPGIFVVLKKLMGRVRFRHMGEPSGKGSTAVRLPVLSGP